MINFFIDCEGEKVAGHGKLIPKKCMNAAERVPNSVLKVKAWYNVEFLETEWITSHENAKKFITATMAYVNHFICSPTLGTTLQTEVFFVL